MMSVLLKDWVGYQYSFLVGNCYLKIRNRRERLASGPQDLGYVCLWHHTSRLYAPLVFPNLGKKLLEVCLHNHSFSQQKERNKDSEVQISVLIGHRGIERLPLLIATLNSIASQKDVHIECIVIEQDGKPQIKEYLPEWIRYFFLSMDSDLSTYNRSAAFNYGARQAKGEILLLHDNDMLVPETYCKEIIAIAKNGFDAINIKRFVFYLNKRSSLEVISSPSCLVQAVPEYIVQNLEAGGSMAIKRDTYFSLGGMDEEFVGWGGEDIEFWQRCSLVNRWIWGFLPIIHLWHKSQPLKKTANNPNIDRLESLDAIALNERVTQLKHLNQM